MNFRDNWGSTLSLSLGVLMFLGAVGQITNQDARLGGLVAGPVMIVGALIYRSAKKRRETHSNIVIRSIAELVGVFVILFLAFGQNDLKQRLVTDPFPNFIIPVWALIVYVFAVYQAFVANRKPD